jgi:hypothetical protein
MNTRHAVLTENALIIALPGRRVQTIALNAPVYNAPVYNIKAIADLANLHDVTHVWTLPNYPVDMALSDEQWDIFTYWTQSGEDEHGERRSQQELFEMWIAGKNEPIFTSLLRRGPKNDRMCRTVKIGHAPDYWGWTVTGPFDILAAVSYLEETLDIPVEWSAGHMGTKLVEKLNTSERRAAWIAPVESVDLRSLPCNYAARDILWHRPLTSADAGLYLHQYDKRSAYLSACPGLSVGIGEPVHYEGNVTSVLPGIYRVAIRYRPPIFDGEQLPAIDNATEWMTDDQLAYAREQGYDIQVKESWRWAEGRRVLESYARKLWDSRATFRTDTARYPHAQGRENAEATMKLIALMSTGRFASRKATQLIRPDWWAKVVGKTRVNILRNLAKFAEQGYKPVLIYSDSLYFLSETPDGAAAVPGILARADGLGGYRHEGTWTVTPDIIEMFATKKPAGIQGYLENAPRYSREGRAY